MSGIRYPHWTHRRDAPNDYYPRPGMNIGAVLRDMRQDERLKRLNHYLHRTPPQSS